MQLDHGYLIEFEGTDGSGKTTTLRYLMKLFSIQNIHAKVTKESRDTVNGAVFTHEAVNAKNNQDRIKFFAKAREYQLEHIVIPLLKQNYLVICDRYVISNMAYQGHFLTNPHYLSKPRFYPTKETRKYNYQHQANLKYVDANCIKYINESLPSFLYPNLIIYQETSAKENVRRLRHRKGRMDKFDKALIKTKKLKHLQFKFHCALKEFGLPYVILNGNHSPKKRAVEAYLDIMHSINE